MYIQLPILLILLFAPFSGPFPVVELNVVIMKGVLLIPHYDGALSIRLFFLILLVFVIFTPGFKF